MAFRAPLERGNAADSERSFRAAVFLVFAVTLVRLAWLAMGTTDLYADEAQYWLWSLHPAWGYFSKPPMVAWLIALTTRLAGSDNELAVRLAAPLLHFGTALVVYATADRLYNARTAFWASVGYATLPGVFVSSAIMSTDAPLLFCWSLALYAFVRAREPAGQRWWIAVGLAAGFGLLSKYAMAYWMLSALLYVVAFRDERRHLGRFCAAMVLALVIYLPNLIWNWQNGFVSYRHTEANAALGGSLFHPAKFLEFFGSQFGVFGPIFFGTLIFVTITGPRTLRNRREAMLAIFALPTLGMMLIVSFLSRAEPNWAAPTYVSSIILVAFVLVSEGQRLLLIVSVALHTVAAVAIATIGPAARALHIELPGQYDPLHRLEGWRRLGDSVSRLLILNPGAVLMADDRELLDELIYYVRPHPLDAVKWNAMGGIHDQFDLTAQPDNDVGRNFLVVTSHADMSAILDRFADAGPIEHIAIGLGGGFLRSYQVRLLHSFKGYAPVP